MDEVRTVVALVLLMAVMIWDLRHRLIPDWAAIGLALLFAGPALISGQWEALGWGLLVATGIFLGGAMLFHFGLIGGGDVKLAGALALWAGPAGIVPFLLVTSLAGGVVSLACVVGAVYSARRDGRPFAAGSVRVPYGIAIALGGMPWVMAVGR